MNRIRPRLFLPILLVLLAGCDSNPDAPSVPPPPATPPHSPYASDVPVKPAKEPARPQSAK
jgi:hypothetical protein